MQRNPMARSARGKNPPKNRAKKALAESSTSNPTAEKPPTSQPEENPEPTPAVVQPPPEVSRNNPINATDDEDPDPEQIMKEFMEKYGKGAKASKFFAQMSEACLKQEKVIPAITPLTIPPRPQNLIETPTSQTLSTHQENPQIILETLTQEREPEVQDPQIETLTQETDPSSTIPQIETESLAEPSTNEAEIVEDEGDMMDNEESGSEEEGGERTERGKVLRIDITGSGDEEETGEGIHGEESTKTGDDKEETGDVEETEGQGEEKSTGEQEDVEGRGRDDEGITRNEEEIGEKEEEAGSGEERREEIAEEEMVNRDQEEKEAEIVLLDEITMDERESPADDRAMRRHHR